MVIVSVVVDICGVAVVIVVDCVVVVVAFVVGFADGHLEFSGCQIKDLEQNIC